MRNDYLNLVFKKAMDESSIPASILAEKANRTRTNISSIRNGHTFPNLNDFVALLNVCEEIKPGFIETYIRLLLGETRRQTLKPEELIDSLEPAEIGSLLLALGTKLTEPRKVATEKKELLLTA
jgi:hypothetical protein